MNRRNFFSESAATVLSSKNIIADKEDRPIDTPERNPFMNKKLPNVPRTTAGLEQYTGPWGFDQAAHLLRRTVFGATKVDTDAIMKKTVSEAVDTLLASEALPSPPVASKDEYYKDPITGVETFGKKAGETWVSEKYENKFEGQRTQSLQAWWLGLMLNQGMSIREKMVLFWHNHFANEAVDVQDSRMMYRQHALLRQFALGNFKDLTREMTLDPAMLRYLNGNTNTKGSPNENYGRELQELFTIGKGPVIAPGNYTNYTEDDIKAASRVLTGWRDVRDPVGITINAGQHDTTDKKFSSAYGNTLIKGTNTGEAGARQELNDLLNMIFAQDETAKFICRKLYRWFIYYVIDDTTEQNVIAPLAQILKSSNYEIKPVLAALLKSAHFYDSVNVGCVIKNPIDLLVGAMKQFGVKFPDAAMLTQQYNAWSYFVNSATGMQMTVFNPPSVAGWAAYYQEPMFYEIWITSDTLPKRNMLTDTMIASGFQARDAQNKNPILVIIDPFEFLKNITDPSDVYTLIDESVKLLFPLSITQNQVDACGEALMGTKNYSEWTDQVWKPYIGDPNNVTKKALVTNKLRGMWKFMMDLAEYQLS